MRKKREIDPAYYENTDFGDYLREADKNGTLIVSLPGENVFDAIKRRDAMLKAAKKNNFVSVRLPAQVANKAKEQAAVAGVPWTAYIRNIVERAVAKPGANVRRAMA